MQLQPCTRASPACIKKERSKCRASPVEGQVVTVCLMIAGAKLHEPNASLGGRGTPTRCRWGVLVGVPVGVLPAQVLVQVQVGKGQSGC